jgi:UDP-3-O-[3-hydroxymyristoyl] glucosamine N-acyltransferase
VNATLRQLADLVQGRLDGDGDTVITAARPLTEAGPGCLTFVEDDKRAKQLAGCPVAAVLCRPGPLPRPIPRIEVADPLGAFLTVFRHLHGRPEPAPVGTHPTAVVHPTARIGAGVNLHPFVVVGEGAVIGDRCTLHAGAVVGRFCVLGADVTLHPHAVLYDGCTVGDRTVIHANAVIGADGFGYRLQDGRQGKVPQLGSVAIGADVEIGAGTAVDRGTCSATRIGDGTKIDNLVQVGHNCRIGRHNLIVSQVGIAGSCTTGDYVVIAGQVGLADHVTVGDGAIIGAQAGVPRDVPAGAKVLGAPAMPEREFKVMALTMTKLPDMHKDLRRVKKHLGLEDAA